MSKRLSENPLPYGRQTLGQEEINAVIEVLKSSYITQGPTIEAFEKAVAEYCNVAYAVAFSSGTAALHGACYAAGLGPGDEAITTPLTFVATSNSVLYQQATPVFADICPATWNLDIEQVREKLSATTKAVLPVHFAGQPVDLEAFYGLADQHGLVVIEDACHALGASYNRRPIGQCRDMAIFSFHPVKSITTGEGGMVVTPHRHVYEKLLQFRTHGITKNPSEFELPLEGPWQYEMHSLGHNYRLTDIQAAMGVVQMSRLNDFIARRNQLTARYRQAFAEHPAIHFQQAMPDCVSADHLFPVWLNPEATSLSRSEVFQRLMDANIRPQVHYMPVHLQPYYKKHLGTKPGDYPKAENYYRHCITLPLYPTLTDDEQDYVIRQMTRILQ